MKIRKKIKSLVGFCLIVFVLLGSGYVLKNITLNQIKKKIQANFDYSHMQLSFFPATLILENARAHSRTPFFSAKKIVVKISFKSLLSKETPFNVYIERPILRIYDTSIKDDSKDKSKIGFALPFVIEKGLIKDGELYFEGKDISCHSKRINALFKKKKDHFTFQAEAERSVFVPGLNLPNVRGKVSLRIESRGKEIDINRIKLSGSDFVLSAKGKLFDVLNPDFELDTFITAKTDFLAGLFQLPFEWEGSTEAKGTLSRKQEEITYRADFSSDDLILNKVLMGRVRGRIDFYEKSGGTVELNIRKRSFPREFVRIHFKGPNIRGTVQGFYLDPIMNFASLPWPVASPAWGSFTMDKRKLQAEVDLRDEGVETREGRFPFNGRVKLEWDRMDEFSFSSQGLASSFSLVDVEGEAKVGQNVDVTIQGEISDVKQAREFTSLVLQKEFSFPEIRGKGRADLHIFGDFEYPRVQAKFSFSPGGFNKFDVDSVEGDAEIIRNDFTGRFTINDPFMKGKLNLSANMERVKTDIQLNRGFAEKILPALDIEFPLQGEGSGTFEVIQKGEDVQVKGDFSSSIMNLSNQSIHDVKGKLMWKGDDFSLSGLQFIIHGGQVKGEAHLGLLSQEFDIDIQGEGVDLSSFYPDINGSLRFNLKGKGVFGQEKALGQFEIEDLVIFNLPKTIVRGETKLDYLEETLYLDLNGNFLPGKNECHATCVFPFKEKTFSIDIKGEFNNPDLLIPWTGAEGKVNYLGEIKGEKIFPQIKGVVDFQGSVFPFPKFAHALRDYSGLIFIENRKVSLRSLRGKFGGGNVQGSGELEIENREIATINLKAEGKNLLLSPLERTRALADGSLNLIKDSSRFVLEGDLLIHKLSWRRELNEKFVFSSSPYYQSQKEPGFFDDLNLNINMKAEDNAWIENSLGRVRGRFDLNISGGISDPIVLGDIEALGGNVYFQDRRFKIINGHVSFFNPLIIEPHISFKGETYVKDYRVTFSLDGLIEHLNPEFSSSPPLPPEDVLALLALGESFRRTYSYDRSTQLSTASLLSFQLSEEAKKRAEGLFTIDRFRIDPFVMGSSAEMAARLTVGKKLSRNFFILYSTNLTTQKEEIARIEWELTDDFSIVGTRDEYGRISFDVKIHKRF